MGMNFTEDQQKAIDSNGKQLLLSAAAGSGKTAVLIERIYRIITDDKLNVDIDKLLVLTFTEAAALEMKTRLIERLEKSLENNPDDENLINQMNLVNYANISTMHSFCSKLIRANFHMLDIDPSFKISGSEEPILLKMEAMFEVMEKKYQEGNGDFHALVEIFGSKVLDNGLVDVIEKLYSYSQNSPYPKKWLNGVVEKYNVNNYDTISDMDWVEVIKDYANKTLQGGISEIDTCINMAVKSGGFEKLLDGLYIAKELFESCVKVLNDDITAVYYYLQDKKIPSLHIYRKNGKDAIDFEVLEKIKIIYKETKDNVSKVFEEFFCKPMEEFSEDVYKLYPLMTEIIDVINLLDEHYTNKKREKNILDFNDLEHFALKILVKEVDGEHMPTEIGIELKEAYHEILVDEYQDTNMVQETIINAIAKDNNGSLNKFMVGDVKQSIYKFRRAKPELFMEKYMTFAKNETEANIRVNLSKNFRSKGVVLDNINFIFKQLMSVEFGGVPYDQGAMLHLGATGYVEEMGLSNSVEYIIGDMAEEEKETDDTDEIKEEKLTTEQLEARIIATKIIKMVEGKEPLMIQCGENLTKRRPVEYGDIVVLFRSLITLPTFIEEFKKFNIPAFGSNKINYFKTLEVQTIISILQIIDNSYQDIHLIGVMHSHIYNFTDDELMEIKGVENKDKFFTCVKNYAEVDSKLGEKVRAFLEDIKLWKNLSKKVTISQLIWNIYTKTNYLIYVSAMENGEVRKGNLRILHEKAFDYEKTSYKDLFNFLKYVEQLEKSETEVSSAKSASENENAVKFMTIHKSKGLEFPVVFVSQMGKKFNSFDEKANLVIHEELGFSFKYFDTNSRVTKDTISRLAIIKQIHKENLAEEMRILYVALTRAKEKLIVTGAVRGLAKKKDKWTRFLNRKEENLPTNYLTTCNNQLDFIMPCLMRSKNALEFYGGDVFELKNMNDEIYNFKSDFNIKIISKDTINNEITDISEIMEFKNIVKKKEINISDDKKEEIFQKLNWENKYFEIPTMVTISEIKRKDETKPVFDIGYDDFISKEFVKSNAPLPKFMDSKEDIIGAKKGTVIHKIMEFLDLSKHKNIEDIKNLTEDLIKKTILTKDEVDSVDLNKIHNFVNSEIGERIRLSDKVYRETNFVIGVEPKDLYGDVISNKKILLHGCIDCYFEEGDDIVLLDYKSDYYNKNTKNTLINNYRLQMDIYKKAIEKSSNKKVVDTYIYLFYGDEFVKI